MRVLGCQQALPVCKDFLDVIKCVVCVCVTVKGPQKRGMEYRNWTGPEKCVYTSIDAIS